MLRIILAEPAFAKVDTPDGKHALIFADQQTGIEFVIPCESDDLKKIRDELSPVAVAKLTDLPK